jgi:hypothetical protein
VTWIYVFPPWQFAIIVVGGMSLLAVAGLIVYRRFIPQNDEVSHNDVAGPIISSVGTILAVVLSFMLVSVWQEYDQAASTVASEVSAIADLYHSAAYIPEPYRDRIRGNLRVYVNAVVNDEWPAMRDGGSSDVARRTSGEVLGIIASWEPKTQSGQSLQQAAITWVGTYVDGRRNRLFDNQEGIPIIMWAGMVFLCFVTVTFCYIFRIRSQLMHALMTVALAAVIGAIFVLIAEFDYPFRGSGQLSPQLFVELQQQITTGATESG